GDRGLVAMAIHTEGLALIDAGRIPEGIALMDEAMTDVLGGDLSPYFTGVIYCNLIEACLGLDDVRRAGEWSDAARVWCDALEPGTPFTSMCRVNRAEVARLRGAWAEAQAEAELATRELERIEPGVAASAFLQLGEIRRRRGDLEGADEAFGRAHELGADPQPGLALLRLSQGQPTVALVALREALDAEVHRPRRIRLLAAQAESAVAAGELADARAAVDELETLAGEAGPPAFEATAATSAGILHLAEGDVASARERLRLAVATWQELRIPYEAARARSLYGQALRADGDEAAAGLELQAARAAFDRLGARRDVEMTDGLLQTTPTLPDRLTEREAEVLRLVASGMTNRDIAVALVLSEHTVARHLQNIFGKIGVSTRAAATAYVYEHGLT
ncbi:MAG TPA: LuxR C-terminal-related transcriptional regulator, partial [Actinomycetota bacterium]